MKSNDFVYLDYAAATPILDFVLEKMQPYFSEKFYNPSSPYAPAVQVRREYEEAKSRLASSFGARSNEIIITAGATESINLAFAQVDGHVVTSAIEHPAVLESAKRKKHTLVAPNSEGVIFPEFIKDALKPETELVSIALANNELGTVQSIRKISAILDAERSKRAEQGNVTPLLFHCDASQGFGQIDIHIARLGVDMLTLNSGKMYGPKQVGLLWAKSSIALRSIIVGGGQEAGVRSGTENVASVIGFAQAAAYAVEHQQAENKRLRILRDALESSLLAAYTEAVVLGAKRHRLPGHCSIAFPDIDAERIVFMLENKGVYVATGSACSANKNTASHVLVGIKLEDRLIDGSLRLTLGKHTTENHIERASREIIEALRTEYERTRIR